MRLVLASASPRRRELLARGGFRFTVRTADAEELTALPDPRLLPEANAEIKARAVAASEPDALVVGADTLVLNAGEVLGKPADLAEAAAMLGKLSGRTHEVITGVALLGSGISESWSEVSRVTFRQLTAEVVAAYLRQVPVLDKAGAYAVQDHGEMLVSDFTGELENIIGLPLLRLSRRLRELGAGC